ncbi:MAG: hypothetical protein FJ009_02355 [Chloroflexi bacterium]|nr:hypothetical protein [Chloroflexota bacterium]
MDTISVARQSQVEIGQLERFRAIYDDSFPPHERADFSSLVDSIAAESRWLYTATRDDALLGFAIIVPFVAREVHLLEYLAVSCDARSGGIGGILLDGIVAAIRNPALSEVEGSHFAIGLILEVEPDDEGDADERALRARRIAFYARHGAQTIDAPNYRAPLADRAGTMRMKLLWLPLADAAAPRGEKLRECITGILEKSYGRSAENMLRREIVAGIG